MIAGLYLAQSVSVDVLCRQHQPEGTGWMLRDDSKTRVIGLELREQTALWLRPAPQHTDADWRSGYYLPSIELKKDVHSQMGVYLGVG